MKNEDKIVELLSESLKKQDQMIDQMLGVNNQMSAMNNQMSGMNTRLDKHEDILIRLVKSVDGLSDLVKHSLDELKHLEKLEERLRRLEKHTGLE